MNRTWYQRIRGTFLAGILVGAPLGVTIWVMVALVQFLESAVRLLPDAWQPQQLLGRPIPGLGVLLALTTILLLGMATRSYVGTRAISLYEALLARVPVISSIYQGIKQLMEAVFLSDAGHFQQVVMVEYPRRGIWAIAFRTGESFVQSASGEMLANIFLPTTPNPTSGFYLLVRESDIVEIEISVEEAFKLIMSAGIVSPHTRHQMPARPPLDP